MHNKMNYCIFAEFENELRPLFEVRRTKSGFYINNIGSKYKDHFTYHPDGASMHKSGVARPYKVPLKVSRRPPLDDFVGPETLMTWNYLLNEVPASKNREVKKQDVVLKKLPRQCSIEVIISNKKVDFELKNDRKTLQIETLSEIEPNVIVEAYTLINNTLSFDRYLVNNSYEFID